MEEFYPFSHFPMYSGLAQSTTVVFVTDEEEQPFAFRDVFQIGAANAKKIFNTELTRLAESRGRSFANPEEKDLEDAAIYTLRYLMEHGDEELAEVDAETLKFYLRTISWEGDELQESDQLLTTAPLK